MTIQERNDVLAGLSTVSANSVRQTVIHAEKSGIACIMMSNDLHDAAF
jgi:hypothetical protein